MKNGMGKEPISSSLWKSKDVSQGLGFAVDGLGNSQTSLGNS